jgi:hypothetical protein
MRMATQGNHELHLSRISAPEMTPKRAKFIDRKGKGVGGKGRGGKGRRGGGRKGKRRTEKKGPQTLLHWPKRIAQISSCVCVCVCVCVFCTLTILTLLYPLHSPHGLAMEVDTGGWRV